MHHHRRQFLRTSAVLGTGFLFHQTPLFAHTAKRLPVACQQYTWSTYFQREDVEWGKDMQAATAAMKQAGLEGYEPSFADAGQVEAVHAGLKAGKIWARSMYVNSTLHEEDQWEQSIADALAIARAAKPMGVEIVVTNPSPIRWGEPIDKTDAQLKLQAKALDQLGAGLRKLGLQLAYHNHDMEMRQSAREFHHMMLSTDPQNVHLCLDAHWIYRGAGNSQVALFDIVRLYADRIVELHIRQSHDGVWSETFGDGDIDYGRLADELRKRRLRPHLVLEQAVETGTPHTMDTVSAIGKSLREVERIFAGLG